MSTETIKLNKTYLKIGLCALTNNFLKHLYQITYICPNKNLHWWQFHEHLQLNLQSVCSHLDYKVNYTYWYREFDARMKLYSGSHRA